MRHLLLLVVCLVMIADVVQAGWPSAVGKIGFDMTRGLRIPREATHHPDSLRFGCLPEYDPPLWKPWCDRAFNRCPDFGPCPDCCAFNESHAHIDSCVPNSVCIAAFPSIQEIYEQPPNLRLIAWGLQPFPGSMDTWLSDCRCDWSDVYGISTVDGSIIYGAYKWSWRYGQLPGDRVPNGGQWDYVDIEYDTRLVEHLEAESPRHPVLEEWAGGDPIATSMRTLMVRAMAFAACYGETSDLKYWRGYQLMMGVNIVYYAAPQDLTLQQEALEHYGVAWAVGDLMSDPEFAQDAQDIIDATCRMPNMDDCIITPIEPSTWGGIKERFLK